MGKPIIVYKTFLLLVNGRPISNPYLKLWSHRVCNVDITYCHMISSIITLLLPIIAKIIVICVSSHSVNFRATEKVSIVIGVAVGGAIAPPLFQKQGLSLPTFYKAAMSVKLYSYREANNALCNFTFTTVARASITNDR